MLSLAYPRLTRKNLVPWHGRAIYMIGSTLGVQQVLSISHVCWLCVNPLYGMCCDCKDNGADYNVSHYYTVTVSQFTNHKLYTFRNFWLKRFWLGDTAMVLPTNITLDFSWNYRYVALNFEDCMELCMCKFTYTALHVHVHVWLLYTCFTEADCIVFTSKLCVEWYGMYSSDQSLFWTHMHSFTCHCCSLSW